MQQKKFPVWKECLLAIAAGLSFLIALLYPVLCAVSEEWTAEEQKLYNAWQNGELIRLHVVAHSDSAWDQAAKRYVRDAIIRSFGDQLRRSEQVDAEQIYDFLCQSTDDFRLTAERALAQIGDRHPVQVQAGFLHLPAKRYGNVILPEGEYKALRITLGEGQGQNWWCVLFPQLCLSLSEQEPIQLQEIQWQTNRIFKHWPLLPPALPLHDKQNML